MTVNFEQISTQFDVSLYESTVLLYILFIESVFFYLKVQEIL